MNSLKNFFKEYGKHFAQTVKKNKFCWKICKIFNLISGRTYEKLYGKETKIPVENVVFTKLMQISFDIFLEPIISIRISIYYKTLSQENRISEN